MAESPGRTMLAELADIFSGIGRMLSDPEVQETGATFLDTLIRVRDRELPAGDRLVLDNPEGKRDDRDDRNNHR